MMKTDAVTKKYEVVIAPECKCKGTYITKAEECPCATALKELLACAGAASASTIEIPASCLTKVGVSVEFLTACRFIQKQETTLVPSPKTKQYVAAPEATKPSPSPETKQYVMVEAAKPSPAPKPSKSVSATASATATATGKDASANASATAFASKNL
eukprot:TRINITY_DN154_c0_g1_i21.p3 TRINITY_DN154_c0_g1~~TRINITY_DN154_c0_g1_i21.p3  ORF type:complete len:167 (-),score=32.96 TRINITY_DN154_c0_g1_i21:350-823(-)